MDAFAAILQAHDIEVVFDSRSLTPGEEYSPEIRKFIDDTSATLVIWTEKSARSKWVRLEANRALERNKLVPIAIGRPKIAKEFHRTETRFFAKNFYKSTDISDSLRGIVSRIRDLARENFAYDENRVRVEYLHRNVRKRNDDEVDSTDLRPFSHFDRMHHELKFVLVPTGKFVMGAREAEYLQPKTRERMEKQECWDRPRFHARVDNPFLMMQTAFTYRMGAWLKDAFPGAPHLQVFARSVSEDDLDKPLTGASWLEVVDLCSFLTAQTRFLHRLPTEVEWEFVARSGSDSAFWFGDQAEPRRAVYDHRYVYDAETYGDTPPTPKRNRKKHVTPSGPAATSVDIGQRQSGPGRMIDMLGNVYEWTEDNPGYKYKWLASVEARPQLAYQNSTNVRVIRGGCYSSRPEMVRCAARAVRRENDRDATIGFRLVRGCARHLG